jgi:RNA polymerase sigma-70 factor (ECF subfamily)
VSDGFALHRRRLAALAYRMLGSRADAEDVVQDAALRWTRSDQTAIIDAGAWLVTTTTRLAIDRLRELKRERARYIGPWLPEPVDDAATDTPALAESLRLAFLLMLERLSPAERAAFLMREVFDADYSDIAHAVGCSTEMARQHVSRARRHVAKGRERFVPEPEAELRLLSQFTAAIAADDYNAMLAILAPDAEAWSDGGGKVLAARNVIHGADKVARLVLGLVRKAGMGAIAPASANGSPAVLIRHGDDHTLFSLAGDGVRITGVFLQRNPDKLAAFRTH